MLFRDYYCYLWRHFLEHEPTYFQLGLHDILVGRRLLPGCENLVKLFSFSYFLNFWILCCKFQWKSIFIDLHLSFISDYLKSWLKHIKRNCVQNFLIIILLDFFLVVKRSFKCALLWIRVRILVVSSFLHSMGRNCQINQLDRSFNLCVDIFDLTELRPWKHVFDIAPPIALLADCLQHTTCLLKLFSHRFHL